MYGETSLLRACRRSAPLKSTQPLMHQYRHAVKGGVGGVDDLLISTEWSMLLEHQMPDTADALIACELLEESGRFAGHRRNDCCSARAWAGQLRQTLTVALVLRAPTTSAVW